MLDWVILSGIWGGKLVVDRVILCDGKQSKTLKVANGYKGLTLRNGLALDRVKY